MSDENTFPKSPETSSSNSSKDPDPGVRRWIRDLAAIVGVIAAIAGIYVGIQGAVEKAKADASIASATLEGEKIKLQIAREQSTQHQADLELEMRRNILEINHQERQASADQERARRESLASVITHMFAENGSSEGDIAVLFDHVDGKRDDVTVIENAALARLQVPRSKSEIELSLRLLERIGTPAIETLVSANRLARQRYDDDLLARFIQAFNEHSAPKTGAALSDFLVFKDQMELVVSRFSYLSQQYDYATINSKTGILLGGSYPEKGSQTQDLVSDQDFAATVITGTSRALARLILRSRKAPSVNPLALSGCFLSGQDWLNVPIHKLNFTDAYVDLTSLSPRNQEQAEQQFRGALTWKGNEHHGMVEFQPIPPKPLQ